MGWLTSWRSVMVTESEPCATAAGHTRTCELMTTVPVRELMITRAGASPGSISSSSSVREKAMRWFGSIGAATLTDTASSGLGGAGAEQLVDAVAHVRARW